MSSPTLQQAAFRELALGPYGATVQKRADGSIILESTDPLRDYVATYNTLLPHWAEHKPDQTLLAWRGQDGEWERLSYRQMLDRVLPLAQYLLGQNLSAERPLLILSENSAEHAMIMLAAIHVGIPFVPLSPAYSLLAPGAERVLHAVKLLTPGLVFAQDAERYANAIEKAVPADTPLVFANGTLPGRLCTSLSEALQTQPGEDVDAAFKAVTPDTILKFLFTSGSTKMPKAVINTHRMMTSNQQMHLQYYPFLVEEPPVLMDWMPWHHTAAGNNNLGNILVHGGTLYIDDGKPTDDGMAQTLRNLREVAPTVYYSVPKGMEILVHEMRRDPALRDQFFSRLRLIFPCGAAMPGPLKQAVDELAIASCGMRIPMTMGLGMTETAPFAISAHLPDWQAGVIGVPAPGCTVKLVPMDGKLEVRYRGPNITPGYWRQPDITAEAFDEEGYFCSGDAATFLDEDAPEKGLRFDGRIAEDFKLASGTWVSVGNLRIQVISAGAPYIHDIALTGHDRDELGMLIFLTPMAAELAGLPEGSPMADIAQHVKIRTWAQQLLDTLASQAKGSSQRIARALILERPANMADNEMTDKGSINQRNILKTRAADVQKLYVEPPHSEVLTAGKLN
ncbi:feruloyl-CoA synthase [Pusillimonas sp. CC-YST705]|uniref:Feruloyl-CoA synthase n=1 Tax=Mesopusillimonas faecipullorum TaxID=2755040 RepID=A0ABS8CCV0_9BURK|nr:feruloyl-CoA synthase [Mesopusillimonas faecipullorum]MCB5363852.1 feruloyl-CoA synthase [Mesopusillimonas faecipullorum]